MDWNDLKDEAARMLFEKHALHIYAALFYPGRGGTNLETLAWQLSSVDRRPRF